MPQEQNLKDRLLDAILSHVAFDGWGDAAFVAAAQDAGVALDVARLVCPRGGVDLAAALHRRGDAALAKWLAEDAAAQNLRFRDKIAAAVKWRLNLATDKEIITRATSLFALPQNATLGARLVWETADVIWRGLGDTSEDYNYYTKRMTLSAVYSATLLFWLGDSSEDHEETWHFLDRRIENVMQFEKAKAQARENKFLTQLFAGPLRALSAVKAPDENAQGAAMPGRWHN